MKRPNVAQEMSCRLNMVFSPCKHGFAFSSEVVDEESSNSQCRYVVCEKKTHTVCKFSMGVYQCTGCILKHVAEVSEHDGSRE